MGKDVRKPMPKEGKTLPAKRSTKPIVYVSGIRSNPPFKRTKQEILTDKSLGPRNKSWWSNKKT